MIDKKSSNFKLRPRSKREREQENNPKSKEGKVYTILEPNEQILIEDEQGNVMRAKFRVGEKITIHDIEVRGKKRKNEMYGYDDYDEEYEDEFYDDEDLDYDMDYEDELESDYEDEYVSDQYTNYYEKSPKLTSKLRKYRGFTEKDEEDKDKDEEEDKEDDEKDTKKEHIRLYRSNLRNRGK